MYIYTAVSRSRSRYFKVKRRTNNKRWRPGTVALHDIHHYQKSTELIMPKQPFLQYVLNTVMSIV